MTAFTQQSDQPKNNSAPIQTNPTVGTNEVYKVGGGVSAPRLVHSIEPRLSRTVIHAKETANTWVRLKLVVEVDGTPSNITVVGAFDKNGVPITGTDSDPIYSELVGDAVEAAKRYRFEPGKKNGKPVRVELMVAINFNS